jgi:hypothetical protein
MKNYFTASEMETILGTSCLVCQENDPKDATVTVEKLMCEECLEKLRKVLNISQDLEKEAENKLKLVELDSRKISGNAWKELKNIHKELTK